MVQVVINGNLRQFTGGENELELQAETIRQLLRQLGERHPGLKPHLEDGIAVAIDGTIYQDAWLEPIPVGSEVHLMPKIAGG